MRRVFLGFILGIVTVTGVHAVQAQRTAAPSAYARLVGAWKFHGGVIVINQSGYGSIHDRTYVNCSDTVLTACDKLIGNEILAGGFVGFQLTARHVGAATGRIYNSSSSWQIGQSLTVTLDSNGALHVRTIGVVYTGCNPPITKKWVCGA